jgi:hypothetical protein
MHRLFALTCLVILGLSLGGCTKCGWIWNDWTHACHSDQTR